METRIRRSLLVTCVGIGMISCCISGVACGFPDDVVYTDLHKNARIGDSVVLKCQFHGTPLAVHWKKGYDPKRAPNLVSWIQNDDVTGKCLGVRLCRIMEMNEDRSLVIKEVSIAEQGRYICSVEIYKGKVIHNFTDINVFAFPKKPYPLINECLGSHDMKSDQTCIISTTEDPINISCTASGYFPDLDLSFLHGFQYITALHSEETTNEDGKKTKSITTQAFSSPEPYMCVASDIPGVGGRSVASVLVTTETVFVTRAINASVERSDSTLAVKIVVPLIFIVLLVAVILGAINRWRIRQHDPVSYVELWKLVDEGDLAKVKEIVSWLVGNSVENTTKEDFYRILCEWKEESSGDVRSLYRAIKKLGFHVDLKRIKDFRTRAIDSVSNDDLERICRHVRSCAGTVKPILRALYSSKREGRRLTFSTTNSFENDLRMMKRWKSGLMPDTVKFRSESKDISILLAKENDMTPMDPVSGEVHLKLKASPPNQTIRLCLALEEAGKTVDERHRPVYLQLAKTFFQNEYESALTNEDLMKFALSLTKRHCQRLGETLELPANIIAAINENDLSVIFRTDAMLRDWVKGQKCSDDEIRRKLRQAAERCKRHDIADIFIPKDKSNIMPFTEPDCLTPTDDNQFPRISVSDGSCSKPVKTTNPPMCGEIKANKPMFRRRSRRSSISSLASTSSENSVEYISLDELNRIGRYLGRRETLLEFGYNLESGDVPEQQTSNTSEQKGPLLSPNSARRAFNRQDSTPSMMSRQSRDTLGKPFRKRHPTYACLLPMKRNDKIFDVELIELAFRLVMADIHPFAKNLDISDQLLTSYKPNFKPQQLNQGTIMMLKAVKTKDRSEMFKVLTTAGYSEEAKAIYFGFEISLHDVLEVENRDDMAQLANKLGVPEDVQPIGPANEISCGERLNPVLLRWKNTVRSSTFNHRLFLSDTIFSMGEKKLALDIISGVYRKRVINKSLSELLANTMKQEQLSTLCEVLDQKGSNCQDVITAWAGEITERSKFDIVGKYEKKPRKLSNKLLENGFYHFAYEIMTGAWRRQEDNKAVETRPQRSHIYKETHLQKLDESGLEESSEMHAPDTADTALNMDPTTTTRFQDSNATGNRQEESDGNGRDEISDTPIQETAKMDHVRQQ